MIIDFSLDPRTVIRQAEQLRLFPEQQREIAARYFAAAFEHERIRYRDMLVIGSLFFITTTAYKVADSYGVRGRQYFPDLTTTGVTELITEQLPRYDVNGHGGTSLTAFATRGVRGAMVDYARMNIASVVKLPEGPDFTGRQADLLSDFSYHSSGEDRDEMMPDIYRSSPDEVFAKKQAVINAIARHETMTDRQKEVFSLIQDGLKQPDIARQLGISEKTVERDRVVAKALLGNFMG